MIELFISFCFSMLAEEKTAQIHNRIAF